MFLEERYESIIELIEKKGRVTVKELSKEFNVTDDCIRKDLRELENRGCLKRVHGGAIPNRVHNEIKSVDERKSINIEQKKKIAMRAVEVIENGDVIFLDVSTINLEIAKQLINSNLNILVITNMIDIVLELSQSESIRVVSIGGEFNKKIGAIIGAEADRYISKFTFDKAFIGVCGINKESGYISTRDIEDGNTKKTIIENSNENYLVMENEKFNYDEFYKFATLNEITGVITETEILN
ncbi:MAG: DeoR/GlpR family DNA-binding transcription regulator [Clostridium sp.]